MGAGIKDMHRNILANQKLIVQFFAAASHVITEQGQIHLTIKSGLPYDLWEVRELAKASKLFSKWTFPFNPFEYTGYEHRRTLGYVEGTSTNKNKEIMGKDCKTYSFTKMQQNGKKRPRNNSDDE